MGLFDYLDSDTLIGQNNSADRSLQSRVAALEQQNAELLKRIEALEKAGKANHSTSVRWSTPQITGNASDFSYVKLAGGVQITGYNGFAQDTIIIPDIVEGLPVTKIGGYAFENCTFMRSIYIPATVERIDITAFLRVNEITAYCYKGSPAIAELRRACPYANIRPAEEFISDDLV